MDQYEPPLEKQQKLNEEEIMDMLNQAEQYENFNEQYIKQNIQDLVKTYKINQEFRFKYSNQPEKFIDSEVELDEIIKKFQSLSAYIELYPAFYPAIPIIISLMEHQNEDIVSNVLQLVEDLIQVDIDETQHVTILMDFYDYLVKQGLFEQLFEILRQNQLLSPLSIMLTMIELRPSYSNFLVKGLPILSSFSQDNDVSLYASELFVEIVTKVDSFVYKQMETILQQMSKYSKTDIQTMNEEEIIQNYFQALQVLLINEGNKIVFNQIEGIQLMLMIIQAKNKFSISAYQIISASINKENLKVFIDNGGLTILFPILMGKGLKDKKAEIQKQIDDTTFTLFKFAFQYSEGIYLERLLGKFDKDIYIKRIFQLKKIYQEQIKSKEYLEQLDQGLSIVEGCDILILELIKKSEKSEELKKKVNQEEVKQTIKIMLENSENVELKYYESLIE